MTYNRAYLFYFFTYIRKVLKKSVNLSLFSEPKDRDGADINAVTYTNTITYTYIPRRIKAQTAVTTFDTKSSQNSHFIFSKSAKNKKINL